jgi:hypothetical protein
VENIPHGPTVEAGTGRAADGTRARAPVPLVGLGGAAPLLPTSRAPLVSGAEPSERSESRRSDAHSERTAWEK